MYKSHNYFRMKGITRVIDIVPGSLVKLSCGSH